MHAITHPHPYRLIDAHTHCKQSKRQVSSPRSPHAAPPSGLGTIERFFAGAAEQHRKTAAPPANARPSPRVAGRTQPSIHAAGGEKSPPARGRIDVSPPHALHTSPLDTPASTRGAPPRRWSKAPTSPHAAGPRPTRTTRSSSAQPDAHRPKPCNAGPRHGRAPTPLAQTPRPPPRAWHTDAMRCRQVQCINVQ